MCSSFRNKRKQLNFETRVLFPGLLPLASNTDEIAKNLKYSGGN